MRTLRAGAGIVALMLCCAPAIADQTSVGVTVNATTGSHIESSRASSIPLLPLPMLEIDHVHRRYHIHLEGVPQLGPVPLTQSDPHYESLAPRVSYLNGELTYRSNLEPIEFGIGETILNQQTVDHVPYLPNATRIHYSRVVGMRLIMRGQVYSSPRRRMDFSIAVNPAMHGLQDGTYAEDASLFDASLRWTLIRSRHDIVYGLRYLNYTAAYSTDHSLGDRNHLFMPFIGIAFHGKQRESLSTGKDPPAPALARENKSTAVGISLFGSNGTRTFTGAYSETPLNLVLIPELQVSHAFGRYEIQADGILPNKNTNPFGSSQTRWSYISAGALAKVGRGALSLGLGETVTNLVPLQLPPDSYAATRSEALDLLARAGFDRNSQGEAYVLVRIDPYVHVSNYSSYPRFLAGGAQVSETSTNHGSRFDATLGRDMYLRRYTLNYGLRYINQTTTYFRMGGTVYLTRSTSVMPFIGFNVGF